MDEMAKNGAEMRRITKTYNRLSILYVAVYLSYAFICLVSGIMIPSVNVILLLLDTIILKCGLVACGVLSCYKHKNSFAFYAVILQLISAIFNVMEGSFLDMFFGGLITGLSFNRLLFILSVIFCVLTVYANKRYEYLETQAGFPHFNERCFNQEFDKKQREIKDEFQQNYERIIKTSSNEMTDIDMNSRDTFPVHKRTPEYDYEHAHDEPERMDTI
ncbi:MAG: hypothetical protein J6B75_05125 [Ruminococcus sp.]|nr:hypothetical protein [Ruminococcus sp.]